ncbi:hypothetical protein H257_18554 [Aphanomyces astaci]|uniref:DDE-1 domain-containing protein n=1 Tax=Aphanomyces astaci TaxID=112090 RepID=W4FCN2_APHAT|nr:hypothetical protein H257_18554 [Aphanomyces astaci]ETV64566.1 hypothetical protein H257_18554 [Aphanomyces astaci]|eukprot:XP_009845947.1 hypothetical protein H257_18554 [Aphanomyces astaci]
MDKFNFKDFSGVLCKQAAALLSFDGKKKRFNLDDAERPEELHDSAALVTFMLKLRQAERAVTCTHLVNFLSRLRYPTQAATTILCAQRLHGSKASQYQVVPGRPRRNVIRKTFASKISSGEKHPYRMTAELSVRANGEKLPILFIMRGVTGGLIKPNKFETSYAVQEKTWIDARV